MENLERDKCDSIVMATSYCQSPCRPRLFDPVGVCGQSRREDPGLVGSQVLRTNPPGPFPD
jgi:hypothetical protein